MSAVFRSYLCGRKAAEWLIEMKYVYSYEKVSCELSGWGALGGNVYQTGDYRSIIDRKGAEGWRYAGFLPVEQRGTGHLSEITLIFEK